MRYWHCHVGGQQYGPVAEDALVRWVTEGRLGPTDYVWTQGLPNWLPANMAMPELFGQVAMGASAFSMVPAAPALGTGGTTPNWQITAQARELLGGRWGLAIGFSFVLALIMGCIRAVPHLGALAALIVDGPFYLGAAIFYLTYARRGYPRFGMMFEGFSNFGNALCAQILMGIFVFLWSLLLIVPGVIAALAYSQTMYILADDRTLGPLEAIRKSKEMMKGYKWKLFCLWLRFFGWALLCILTLGIGFLWLVPYMSVSYARFYDDLRPGPAPQAEQVGTNVYAHPAAPAQQAGGAGVGNGV